MSQGRNKDFELGIYLIFGGGWLVFSGIRRFRRKRDVEDTSTTTIRSAAQGSAEVQGYAWPLVAQGKNNLNGEKCVFRHLVVLKKVHNGKNSSWVKVYEDHHELPFLVFDQTATLLVKPEYAEYQLREVKVHWKDIHPQMQESLKAEISDRSFPPSGSLFSTKFEFNEKYIVAGSPIYLRGNFSTPNQKLKVEPEGGFIYFRDKVRSLTPDSSFVKLLDRNRDGEISEDEARIGFSSAAAISLRQKTVAGRIVCAGLMANSVSNGLYIADCHQKHLLNRIKTWNLLRIIAGAILIGAGVILILSDLEKQR